MLKFFSDSCVSNMYFMENIMYSLFLFLLDDPTAICPIQQTTTESSTTSESAGIDYIHNTLYIQVSYMCVYRNMYVQFLYKFSQIASFFVFKHLKIIRRQKHILLLTDFHK